MRRQTRPADLKQPGNAENASLGIPIYFLAPGVAVSPAAFTRDAPFLATHHVVAKRSSCSPVRRACARTGLV